MEYQVARMRLAVVLDAGLSGGPAANAAAIVMGGLCCAGFGDPIEDADGHSHAAILWNLVVLKAKSPLHLLKLIRAARLEAVRAVAFTSRGQDLSNSFEVYKQDIRSNHTAELGIVAVGLFGREEQVRSLTRTFSLF
jgi:hypothetical protein